MSRICLIPSKMRVLRSMPNSVRCTHELSAAYLRCILRADISAMYIWTQLSDAPHKTIEPSGCDLQHQKVLTIASQQVQNFRQVGPFRPWKPRSCVPHCIHRINHIVVGRSWYQGFDKEGQRTAALFSARPSNFWNTVHLDIPCRKYEKFQVWDSRKQQWEPCTCAIVSSASSPLICWINGLSWLRRTQDSHSIEHFSAII